MKIGTNDISKIYLGSAEIEKIYLGTEDVYESGDTPTPPTPSYETSLEYRYIPSYNVSATVLTTYGVVGEYAKYNDEEDNHNVNANANPTSAQQFMTQLYSSSNVIESIPSSQGNFYVSKLFKSYSNYQHEDLYIAGNEDNGWGVTTFKPFDMGDVDSADENGNAVEFNQDIHSNTFTVIISNLDGTVIATYNASPYDGSGIGFWSVGDSIYLAQQSSSWECYISMSNIADDSDWGSATETYIDTLCRNAGLNDGDVFKVEMFFNGINTDYS